MIFGIGIFGFDAFASPSGDKVETGGWEEICKEITNWPMIAKRSSSWEGIDKNDSGWTQHDVPITQIRRCKDAN